MKKILLLFISVFYLCKINGQCSFTVTPVSSSDTICSGSSITFLANGGPSNYIWTLDSVWVPGTSSSGPGGYVWTAPIVVGTSSVVTLAPTVTTKYTVTDTGGGCNAVQNFVITVNPKPNVIINTNYVICSGYSARLIATGAQSYSWSPNPNIVTAHGDTATFYSNYPYPPSSVYTVTGTDSNGCSAIDTATLITDSGPNVYYTAYTACANVGHSYVVLYGATLFNCPVCYGGPFGIQLVGGDTLLNNLNATQTYTVFATDAYGCNTYYSGIITVNPIPVFTANSPTVCSGQTVNLSASDSSLQYAWTNQAGNFTSNVQNPSILNANSSVGGNYYVTGTNANGCYNTDTINVTIEPPVTVSYIMTKDSVAANTWDVYPTYSPLVTSAIWYWGDGTSTTGLYPTHVYAAAGTYNVWVTVFSSCGDSGSYFQNVSIYRLTSNTVSSGSHVYVNIKHGLATGIATIATDNVVTIYPNPVEDNFNLILNTYSPTTHLTVYNALGQMIINQPINALSTPINLNFAAGVYQVFLVDAGKTVYQTKLIKQ